MAEPVIREASCACGSLRIVLRGDPAYVSSCACQQCQKRTGSFFGVTAFFDADQVAAQAGEAKIFERISEGGVRLGFRFCPDCGSTVWFERDAQPGKVSVPVGAFADPDFPGPQRMIWTEHRNPWVVTPDGLPEFPKGPS